MRRGVRDSLVLFLGVALGVANVGSSASPVLALKTKPRASKVSARRKALVTRVRDEIQTRGWSTAYLAKRLRRKPQSLYELYRRPQDPTLETILSLAKALQIYPADLHGDQPLQGALHDARRRLWPDFVARRTQRELLHHALSNLSTLIDNYIYHLGIPITRATSNSKLHNALTVYHASRPRRGGLQLPAGRTLGRIASYLQLKDAELVSAMFDPARIPSRRVEDAQRAALQANAFGRNVFRELQAVGCTRTHLGRLSQVSPSTIKRYIQGRRAENPTLKTLLGVAVGLTQAGSRYAHPVQLLQDSERRGFRVDASMLANWQKAAQQHSASDVLAYTKRRLALLLKHHSNYPGGLQRLADGSEDLTVWDLSRLREGQYLPEWPTFKSLADLFDATPPEFVARLLHERIENGD